MQSVQQKLKYQMMRNGLKLNMLAKAASVPESSIKNIIYGKSQKPNIELIEALAAALDCTAVDLLADTDPRYQKKTDHSIEWDGQLYLDSLQTVLHFARENNQVLSRTKATQYAERLYQYALANNENTIDVKFAKYLLANNL
jgi:hypothetical protein